jgi:predicted DNA-binding transcriptional regulator AlpA
MKLLTAEDIAEVLQVRPRTVKERIALRGDFPQPVVVGSIKRWLEEEVTHWLLQQRQSQPKKVGRPRRLPQPIS